MSFTPEEIRKVLLTAADLLGPRGAWLRGMFATDGKGRGFSYGDDMTEATCFCVNGALYKASGGDGVLFFTAQGALERAIKLRGGGVPQWNDAWSRRKNEVINALHRTARLQQEETP